MAEVKFSDFPIDTTPSLTNIVVGLSSGDNAGFTLQTINDLFQEGVAGDPLPAGSPTKVMYYNPVTNKWGASSTLITDGFVLGVGNTEIATNALVNIEDYDDAYDFLLNAYTKTAGDVITKTLTYTNRGILFVAEGSIPTNIDNPTNAMTYGMWIEKGIVAQENLYLNNINGSGVKFGDINGTTGLFDEQASIYSSSDFIGVKAKTISIVDDTGVDYIQYSYNGTVRSSNSMFYKIQTWHNLSSAQSGGILLSTNAIGSDSPDASIRSALHIGGNNSGNTNMITVSLDPDINSHDDSLIVLQVDKDGKIFGRFPSIVGDAPAGALLQLYVEGGVVKAG